MTVRCVATTMAPTQFGKNLRKLRVQRGLTQAELAELTGMMQNFVSRLESSANTNPQYDTMRRLAVALGMSTDEFVRAMEATD